MSTLPPAKILIVRLSALGDVVQTLPLLDALKQQLPQAQVGWLVESDAAELLRQHPQLDFLHVSHRKRWLKQLGQPRLWASTWREIQAFRAEIQATDYDVALDTQGLLKSAVLLAWTGIQNRIGLAAAREGAPWFYTQRVALADGFFDPKVPILKHFLTLLTALKLPVPEQVALSAHLRPAPPEAEAQVQALLARVDQNKPLIALAPATMWESKHWPPEAWHALITLILSETTAQIVIVGGPKDKALAETLLHPFPEAQTQGRLRNWTGQTSLMGLQALSQHLDVLVGPDSAPLHIAGASGKPFVIGLYGPTSPHRTPPPGHSSQRTLLSTALPCQPCDETRCPLGTTACLRDITPEDVFQPLQKHLAQLAATP